METLIMELAKNQTLSREDLIRLLTQGDETHGRLLAKLAAETCVAHYGVAIYTRGLIEFTNHCQNNCYYCGIRRGADHCQRYRLTPEDVLTCCQEGYALGFRTFVLQGGEDPYFNDDRLVAMVAAIHRDFPTCAITLSVGERSTASYKRLFDAGADRYLLRHETANPDHYHSLHPKAMDMRRPTLTTTTAFIPRPWTRTAERLVFVPSRPLATRWARGLWWAPLVRPPNFWPRIYSTLKT